MAPLQEDESVDEWTEDEFSGEDEAGRLVTRNPIGEYYGGRNDKNERHGRGRAELPNGDLFLGCYFRGKRHGLGVYRYKNGNGARYGGDWYLGVKTGWGTMYFPDGSQYTGCWSLGKIHGWGVYVYPNGDEYEGWWYKGQKNGRGIYRVKKSGEKFVGNWVLGMRQGKGMLIRKEHRFIGNWYNDCPRGPGVYIFQDLGVEQHGLYNMIKLNPQSIDSYKEKGFQVLQVRKEPPPKNPSELENETRAVLAEEQIKNEEEMKAAETEGEGNGEEAGGDTAKSPSTPAKKKIDIMAKTPEQEFEEKLDKRMQELIDAELASELMPVAPLWRVVQITGLMTPLLDETVPPPPIPETPGPLIEPESDENLDDTQADDKTCKELEEEEARALMLAKEHALGDPYTGSGTCQLDLSAINWPDDCPPALRCSQMSFSNLDDLKNIVQSVLDKPLEPVDFEKIVAQNLHLFKGQGLDVSDRWKECLENETDCVQTEIKGAPEVKRGSNKEPETGAKRGSKEASEKRESQQSRKSAEPRTSVKPGEETEEEEFEEDEG